MQKSRQGVHRTFHSGWLQFYCLAVWWSVNTHGISIVHILATVQNFRLGITEKSPELEPENSKISSVVAL